MYIDTTPSLLPQIPDSEMIIGPYEIPSHVAPISNGNSGGNVNSGAEIMTNVMAAHNSNGNNYGNSRRKWTYEMVSDSKSSSSHSLISC